MSVVLTSIRHFRYTRAAIGREGKHMLIECIKCHWSQPALAGPGESAVERAVKNENASRVDDVGIGGDWTRIGCRTIAANPIES